MMMRHICNLLTVLFLAGCTKPQPSTEGNSAVQSEASRFDGLDLTAGMDREKVEEQVSALLGKPKTYSPYGNNLLGGTVQYRDQDWVLEVMYKPGAPAPTIVTTDGKTQGYPPLDETVIEYKTKRIPNKPTPVRNVLDWRGKGTTCHVHGVGLSEETVAASPRLTVSFEQEFDQAMIKEFPRLGHAFGIDDLSVTHVTVRYCQKCRDACAQWHLDDAKRRKQEP